MKELMVFEVNGQILTDSRYVADMVGDKHDQLMRKIRRYIEVISHSAEMQSDNFFIESSYLNSRNQHQPCYLVTKKGCDMIANKMQGDKGILFTAMYVSRFEELEKHWLAARYKGKATRLEVVTAIRDYVPETPNKRYRYKHYTDLAYKLSLGANAKQLREERGISKEDNLRDVLTVDELTAVDSLENEISVLLGLEMDYQTIKDMLTKKYNKQPKLATTNNG